MLEHRGVRTYVKDKWGMSEHRGVVIHKCRFVGTYVTCRGVGTFWGVRTSVSEFRGVEINIGVTCRNIYVGLPTDT